MKSVTMRRRTVLIVLAYVVALHAVLAFALFKTNFIPLARKTLGLAPPEERNVALYQAMLQWPERDRLVPMGAVVVLGDSLLQDLGAAQLGREVHSFALGGTTASTLLEGLALVPCIERAGVIVLGVGANDLKYRDPEGVVRDYAAVLAALPPSVEVVALPILPAASALPPPILLLAICPVIARRSALPDSTARCPMPETPVTRPKRSWF